MELPKGPEPNIPITRHSFMSKSLWAQENPLGLCRRIRAHAIDEPWGHMFSSVRLIVCLAATLCGVAINVNAVAALPNVETRVPPALLAVIQHEYPRYKIVQTSDIDLSNCEEPKAPPGLVEGDFNGDKHTDYAVLLAGSEVKEIQSSGQVWKAVDVKFVIYLWRQGSGLQNTYMESYVQVQGTIIIGLQLVSAGVVVNESPVMGDKKVTLKYQGVDKYHCGKWADVYYWDEKAKRFDSIRVVE